MSIPPSNYPPPPGGYGPTPSAGSGNGTLILVLGILSIVCLPILGPVALIMGNNALKSGSVDPSQLQLVNAGRICGIVGCVFLVLGVIYWIAILAGVAHGLGTPNGMGSPMHP